VTVFCTVAAIEWWIGSIVDAKTKYLSQENRTMISAC
jgi:hypothetical protein